MSVSVDQFLMLHFDQSGQRIAVSAMGQATVSVSYNGPFAGEIIPTAKAAVGKYVDTLLAGALGQAQDEVNMFSAPDMTSALVDALRSS